jgi:hypothetical protein
VAGRIARLEGIKLFKGTECDILVPFRALVPLVLIILEIIVVHVLVHAHPVWRQL